MPRRRRSRQRKMEFKSWKKNHGAVAAVLLWLAKVKTGKKKKQKRGGG